MKCIPRPLPKVWPTKDRLRTPWDFFKSVFKNYEPDTEVLRTNCFNFDWGCSKIEKVCIDATDLGILKEYLRENYKLLRETYKYYAAIAPAGLIPSIGSNVFSDILSNCEGAIDNKTLKLSDLDLEFVSTNAGVKKHPRNPER